MGWGCYKHEADARSDNWVQKTRDLSDQKLKEDPRTWGRDSSICPWCYEELEIERDQLRHDLDALRQTHLEETLELDRIKEWIKQSPLLADLKNQIDDIEAERDEHRSATEAIRKLIDRLVVPEPKPEK